MNRWQAPPNEDEEWVRRRSGWPDFARKKQPTGTPCFCVGCHFEFFAEVPRRWCSWDCHKKNADKK